MLSRLVAVTVFALMVGILLVLPMHVSSRGLRALLDLAHVPVFAVLAVLVWRAIVYRWPQRKVLALMAAWLLVSAWGVATEWLQKFSARNPSWHDVAADALGAGIGLLWVAQRKATKPRPRAAMLILCSLLAVAAVAQPGLVFADAFLQWWRGPLLASFESPLELSRWTTQNGRIQRCAAYATEGTWALQIELQPGKYPGVALTELTADWSGYRQLLFDVYLEGSAPLDLIVKIQDAWHNGEFEDRFHQTVRLLPGRQQVRVALAEVRQAPQNRIMDLRSIAMLQWFTVDLREHRTLYLDNVHLE